MICVCFPLRSPAIDPQAVLQTSTIVATTSDWVPGRDDTVAVDVADRCSGPRCSRQSGWSADRPPCEFRAVPLVRSTRALEIRVGVQLELSAGPTIHSRPPQVSMIR